MGALGVITPGLHVNSKALGATGQGAHLIWNESNGRGETTIICNAGTGIGGFVFRTVNNNNTQEFGRVDISGVGDLNTSRTLNEMSQRVFSPNNPPPYPVKSVNGFGGDVSIRDGFSTDNSSMWWDSAVSSLRIQIGSFSLPATPGASVSVALPKAFPNVCLFAVPVPDSSAGSTAATEQIGVTLRTNTVVNFTKGSGDSSARGGKYLAIGY